MPQNELLTPFNNGLLSEPGDNINAYVSQTGKQIIKIHKNDGRKASFVRYPSTGTVVKTQSNKKKK